VENTDAAARNIYRALCNDEAAIESLRAESRALALAIATDGNASGSITSSTVNGQSFAMTQGFTPAQRLAVLSRVVQWYDAGGMPSRTAITVL
jgi:hypothetical protein